MSDLTIFVSTFNRIDTLINCLASLQRQTRPKRIVIVDNGSTDPTAIALLKSYEKKYTVYWFPAIEDVPENSEGVSHHGGHGMQSVERNITRAFQAEQERTQNTDWYAMTDADLTLDGPPYSLDAYIWLAQGINCAVGPHLRLNVHRNYPLRSAAIILNARTLFRERMEWFDGIPYSFDPIDTTFHLFPASDHFDRLKMRTVRVGYPYWATHTDWMIDVYNPTEENRAYILGSGEAASWGGRWISEFFRTWLKSPEDAFLQMEAQRKKHDDYYYDGFILSWMLQYGHGCEVDTKRATRILYDSFPDWSPCWEYKEHWSALLREDETCLGWI